MSYDVEEPKIDDFTTFRNFLSCSTVQDIEYEYRCEYVQNTTECKERQFFFNYIEILYCGLKPTNNGQMYACLLLFVGLVTVMFLILGTTADKYFCPPLEMLSKVMGLSEHLAGITLLAFGNGSPDLFTSLASLDDDTMTLYSNVLSGAIFVTAFVGGIICITQPLHISGNGLLRDTTFFILGVLFMNYIMETDEHVTRTEAVCFFSIYIFYLFVIIVDLHLIKRSVSKMEKLILKGGMSVFEFKYYADLKQEASMDILAQGSRATFNIESTVGSFYGYGVEPNANLYEQLLQSLNPIDEDEWYESSRFGKTLICLKLPIKFLLSLFIPTCNYELERHGWSKLLNCIQVVTLPLVTVFLMFELKTLFGIPIFLYTVIFTLPIAFWVFHNSRTDCAPSFHVGFACLAAYGSVFVIFSCASEIVEVLYILGLVLNCSNSFLGCTLLAWGNGIGDLVANIALALHGYHKMAFAACYGGPFFNNIMCLGLVVLIKTMQSEDGQVYLPGGPLGANCFIFMVIVLFGTLMWSTTTNFYVRRSVGIFNILIYSLFFLYTILAEWEVIQTYAEVKEYGFE